MLQQQAVVRVLSAERDGRRRDPDVAQRKPFLDQSDSQPVGASIEKRSGGDDRSVSVAVGLHDREHAAARRRAARFAQIVHQRRDVDARLRRTHAQIERAARGIAQRESGRFGHGGLPSSTVPHSNFTTSNSLVGFPAPAG